MAESVLLRFRDLTANVDTIEAHNAIIAKNGRALWGWWKKPLEPMPDPGLTDLGQNLKPGQERALFVDSASNGVFRAPIFRVHYQPGGSAIPPPFPDLCPEYYREKELPAWFEVGSIMPIGRVEEALTGYVFSPSNRTISKRSITTLQREAVGEIVTNIDFLDSNVSLWFITPTEDVGLLERSDIVRPLDKGIWPCKGKYLLHLSDLHFGIRHAFRNELGAPQVGRESMAEAILQDLESLSIKDQDIAFIIVSGDLTWTGDPHEFANAEAFLGQLTQELGLHKSQVLICPGNHDIEWRDTKGDVDPNAELNYRNFLKNFYNSEPTRSFLRVARFRVCNRVVTSVILNSCRIETKENAGLGFVGREQLHEAVRFLRALAPEKDEIRIATIHHHLLPVNYVEGIDWPTKRVSITIDAEAVVRTLMSVGVRAVFHGHQHQPYLAQLRRIIQGFVDPFDGEVDHLDATLAVIGGGSIGVERGHLNVVGRNAYNIVDLSQGADIGVRTRIQSPVGPGFSDYQRSLI